MKKIVAVNASPRAKWNTAQLVREAAAGAQDAGAEVEVVDLYKLDAFTGCRSCFICKQEKFEGTCVVKDGLADLLAKMRDADGLILGSPIYFGDLTAGFRALYERLCFQYLTYRPEDITCNQHRIPVLLIVTSNVSADAYDAVNYGPMIDLHVNTLNTQIGPTTLYKVGATMQVADYSRYNWTMFDADERVKRHEEIFPGELARARELGAQLLA
ncbi:MAG: flavodoxin family protein [Coriobacteriaceae bacterium]|nr:flavodoxin family protein [Coriobacteriaceae bacterium]